MHAGPLRLRQRVERRRLGDARSLQYNSGVAHGCLWVVEPRFTTATQKCYTYKVAGPLKAMN